MKLSGIPHATNFSKFPKSISFFFGLHFFSTVFFVRKSDFAHISALGSSKTIENEKSEKLALCGMYSKSRFYHQNNHPTSSFSTKESQSLHVDGQELA